MSLKLGNSLYAFRPKNYRFCFRVWQWWWFQHHLSTTSLPIWVSWQTLSMSVLSMTIYQLTVSRLFFSVPYWLRILVSYNTVINSLKEIFCFASINAISVYNILKTCWDTFDKSLDGFKFIWLKLSIICRIHGYLAGHAEQLDPQAWISWKKALTM